MIDNDKMRAQVAVNYNSKDLEIIIYRYILTAESTIPSQNQSSNSERSDF
jgi:hypothetical protein